MYYRTPKSHQVHVMNAKNNPFSRAKRRYTPDYFADILRSDARTKTWKDNKKKKQWM